MGMKPGKTDRTFVVIGGVGNGKSALCNLLYGQRYFFLPYKFKSHQNRSPNSITSSVQKEFSWVEQESGENILINTNKYLYYDIFDQCGIGDANVHLDQHANNMKQCYLSSDACMNITFLIVVSIVDTDLFEEYLPIINSILMFMKNDSYNIADNAVLVCTKKDLYMENNRIRDNNQLEDQFNEDIETPGWTDLKNLLKQVGGRKIFVNCYDYSRRREILYDLFKLCPPKLTIMIHGNKLFPGEKMMQKLERGKESIYEYRIVLKVAQDFDFDIKRQDESFQGEEHRSEEIRTMRNLVDGISVISILINLQKHYTRGMDKFIRRLSTLYGFNESREWWKFIIIIFLTPEECTQRMVTLQINENHALRSLVARVKGRYVLATEGMCVKRLMDNVLQMCFEVKRENKGKDFINQKINKEIIDKGLKDAYEKQREQLNGVKCKQHTYNETEVFIPGLLTCKSVRVPKYVVLGRIDNYGIIQEVYNYLIAKDSIDPIAQEIKDNYIELDDYLFCKLYKSHA